MNEKDILIAKCKLFMMLDKPLKAYQEQLKLALDAGFSYEVLAEGDIRPIQLNASRVNDLIKIIERRQKFIIEEFGLTHDEIGIK